VVEPAEDLGWTEAMHAPAPPAPVEEEPEEHFVPPPPPPLPRIDARTKLAWLGVLSGPVYLLLRAWFGWSLFYCAEVLVLLAFVAGAVGRVSGLRDDDGDDYDPDDGAVV